MKHGVAIHNLVVRYAIKIAESERIMAGVNRGNVSINTTFVSSRESNAKKRNLLI